MHRISGEEPTLGTSSGQAKIDNVLFSKWRPKALLVGVSLLLPKISAFLSFIALTWKASVPFHDLMHHYSDELDVLKHHNGCVLISLGNNKESHWKTFLNNFVKVGTS
jgi:hypothetical protein